MSDDESLVLKGITLLEEHWFNPFSTKSNKEFVNLATGAVFTKEVREKLMASKQSGEDKFQQFIHQRLETQDSSFFDPIHKENISFAPTKKSMPKSVDQDAKAQSLFSRMLLIAQGRGMNISDVLQYPLGSKPLALATPDGDLVSSPKYKLGEYIELGIAPMPVPPITAVVIDAMALIQSLMDIPDTFGEFAMKVFQAIMKLSQFSTCQVKRYDFVSDRYLADSIKMLERKKRAQGEGLKYAISGNK